jgi:hypothetical protein
MACARPFIGLSASLCLWLAASCPAVAADLGEPLPAADKWEFSFTPYGWMINVNGNVTARGHSADVNEDFFQIVEKSDSLLAWMSYFEARKGRFALFTDLVWMDLGFPGHINVRGSPFARFPSVVVSATGKAQIDYDRPSSSRASPMKSRAGRAHRAASPPSMCWAARATGTRMSAPRSI